MSGMNSLSKADALVSKGSVSDAQYVGNGIEEVIKQLSVNKQHIEMFCAFYLKVLDRMFGEDVTTSVITVQNLMWQKGSVGGWLKQLIQTMTYRDESSPLRVSSGSYFSSLNMSTLKLLRHFFPHSAMFDLLSKIDGGCEVKLPLLPFKTQLFLTDHPVYSSLKSDNELALCKLLLNSAVFNAHHVSL